MKKSKTKSKTKRDGDSDLDEMREAFRRHKERAKGGGSSKNDWDKLSDGKNWRFILPRPGERKFYAEGYTHFRVGPNERAVRCIDEDRVDPERGLPTSGSRCPLCKKFLHEQSRINSEYEKGDKDGRREWGQAKDKYAPRHQFYSNVLREDDDGDFEVKIYAYGPQVWGQLMNYFLGDDTDVGDFTDPENGRWMNVKKEKKGGRDPRNVEYKVYAVDGPDISDAWDAIKEALHDLDAACGQMLSVDEVVAIMKGVDGDDDDRRSSRRKSRDDDDEDEDDEDGDEDDVGDDEDEDEVERPVNVKKSKLASKMKKRRGDD